MHCAQSNPSARQMMMTIPMMRTMMEMIKLIMMKILIVAISYIRIQRNKRFHSVMLLLMVSPMKLNMESI